MIKAEWGTKRSCPKCATRFYDLTKDDPVSCINCGYSWIPESVLKSKQPMPFEEAEKPGKVVKEHTVPFARPRDIELTYDNAFNDMVHVLHGEIAKARVVA